MNKKSSRLLSKPRADLFVPTQSDLAQALGISRQAVSAHLRKNGAPRSRKDGRFYVAEWRHWLADISFADRRPSTRPPRSTMTFEDGLGVAQATIGNTLASSLRFALDVAQVTVSPRRFAALLVALWECTLAAVDGQRCNRDLELFGCDEPQVISEARQQLKPSTV